METRGLHHRHAAHCLMASLLAPALLMLTSCQQNDLSDPSATTAGEQKALLDVQTSIQDVTVSDVISRSLVGGTTLNENGRTYGIFVCKHEDTPTNYETYDDGKLYANIQAWYNGSWYYSYQKSSSSRFQPLYVVSNADTDNFDVYAYSPWKSGVTLTGGYDYDLTSTSQDGIVDPMYATYDGNTDLHITKDATLTPSVTFHHALARIVFHFKLANEQNTGLDGQHALRLYQIQLVHKSDGATPLYTRGRMNLLTGEVTPLQQSSGTDQTLTCATGMNTNGIDGWDIYSSTVWRDYNMLVHPTTYQTNGDFIIKFWFNGTGSSQTLINTYAIQKSDLDHGSKDESGNEIYGFQPGYTYHFYFVIDNYIHLQNVLIDQTWTNTTEEELKV